METDESRLAAVRCIAWLGFTGVGLERSILFLIEDVENPVEVAELCSFPRKVNLRWARFF